MINKLEFEISMLFPDFKRKCLVMSFDDGSIEDRLVVDVFNKNNIVGTFHLNSKFIGDSGKVKINEIVDLYEGHEVSAHSLTHKFLNKQPLMTFFEEVVKDREELENYLKKPVRGMSLPFGTYEYRHLDLFKACGIEYNRTIKSNYRFDIPDNLLAWHPTIHFFEQMDENSYESQKVNYIINEFFNRKDISLLYIWGHSYELNHEPWLFDGTIGKLNETKFNVFQYICEKLGNKDHVYYAKNIDLADYINAYRNLKFSVNRKYILNQSSIDIFLLVNNNEVKISSGDIIEIVSRILCKWNIFH